MKFQLFVLPTVPATMEERERFARSDGTTSGSR